MHSVKSFLLTSVAFTANNVLAMKIPTTKSRVENINHAEAGRLIRQKREARGLSLRRLAKEMGVSAPFLCDLERGNRNWTEKHWDKAQYCLTQNP